MCEHTWSHFSILRCSNNIVKTRKTFLFGTKSALVLGYTGPVHNLALIPNIVFDAFIEKFSRKTVRAPQTSPDKSSTRPRVSTMSENLTKRKHFLGYCTKRKKDRKTVQGLNISTKILESNLCRSSPKR